MRRRKVRPLAPPAFDCREGVARAGVECRRDDFFEGFYVAFRALL